jgi:hypothetical protein
MFHRVLSLLLASGAYAPAAPQQSPTPPASAPEERRSFIEGRVVNAATGAPLKKADLVLGKVEGGREPGYSARSDVKGRFVFRDIEPGKYRLWATRTGFARQEYGGKGLRQGVTLTVEPGSGLTGVVFPMQPQGVITGVVTDEDGEPVMGAQVMAGRRGYLRERRQVLPAGGWSETDDLGEFRIFALAPGRYVLSASEALNFGWGLGVRAARDKGDEQSYAPTYYPGTVDEAAASEVEVKSGAEVRIHLALQRVRTVRVRGRVVSPFSGRPENPVMVMLEPREGSPGGMFARESSSVGPGGSFELRGVIPGSYTLVAYWQQGEERYTGRKSLDVGAVNLDDVVVELTAGAKVSGTLRVEGSAEVDYGALHVLLEPDEPRWMGGGSARVNDDGSFVVANAAPGRYRVRTWGAPEACYVKSVKAGGEETVESGFDVAGEMALDVVLSATGGHIEGEVVNEQQKPLRGARVALLPVGAGRSDTKKALTSDQNGRYRLAGIAGIAPGEYRLFAWEQVEEQAWEDPEFLKPFEDRATRVRVEENSSQQLRLQAFPAERTEAPPAPVVKPVRRAKGATR